MFLFLTAGYMIPKDTAVMSGPGVYIMIRGCIQTHTSLTHLDSQQTTVRTDIHMHMCPSVLDLEIVLVSYI